MKGVPEVLDKMTDAVLAYRPKPKSKAAKKRRRKAAKNSRSWPPGASLRRRHSTEMHRRASPACLREYFDAQGRSIGLCIEITTDGKCRSCLVLIDKNAARINQEISDYQA